MKGIYKGTQTVSLSTNREAIYMACTCISLNLCREQAAESCYLKVIAVTAITFFGVIQKLYIFTPRKWEI